MAFEKSATLTQFSGGLDVDTIPVPATHLVLHDAFKQNRFGVKSDDGSFSASLFLDLLNYRRGGAGTGSQLRLQSAANQMSWPF